MNSQSETNNEKLYTGEELENIIEQRLARERKNSASLKKVREFLSYLRKKDEYKSLSNAELAERIDMLLAGLADKINDGSTVPDGAAQEKENVKETPQKAEKAEKTEFTQKPAKLPEKDAENDRVIFSFIEKYGEDTLVKLIRDRAFPEFCKGKNGDLSSLYESYRSFLAALAENDSAKKYRLAETGLASTGFSGHSSGAPDYGSMLTDNQKRLAMAAGMSAKQYAELLSQIPSKNLKTN